MTVPAHSTGPRPASYPCPRGLLWPQGHRQQGARPGCPGPLLSGCSQHPRPRGLVPTRSWCREGQGQSGQWGEELDAPQRVQAREAAGVGREYNRHGRATLVLPPGHFRAKASPVPPAWETAQAPQVSLVTLEVAGGQGVGAMEGDGRWRGVRAEALGWGQAAPRRQLQGERGLAGPRPAQGQGQLKTP